MRLSVFGTEFDERKKKMIVCVTGKLLSISFSKLIS